MILKVPGLNPDPNLVGNITDAYTDPAKKSNGLLLCHTNTFDAYGVVQECRPVMRSYGPCDL